MSLKQFVKLSQNVVWRMTEEVQTEVFPSQESPAAIVVLILVKLAIIDTYVQSDLSK